MIDDNKVASFEYVIKNDSGQIIGASEENTPLVYLHGSGAILASLEQALKGKKTGDSFSVKIAADDAYGQRNDNLVQKVERSVFNDVEELNEGMVFTAQSPEGDLQVTVVGIEGDEVLLDGNHPLAGQNLNFDIVVGEIRDATAEELSGSNS